MVRVQMTENTPITRPLAWLILLALAACCITLLSGWVSTLTYTAHTAPLQSIGLTLQHLRAIHTTFSFAWVFLGGVAVVYFYLLSEFGPFSAAARRRFVWHLALWSVAGIGILVTLLAGKFSGREYAEYHPAFAALILIGWLLFARNYFAHVGFSLRHRPVYIYMWTVGIPLFVYASLEGRLYLLDVLSNRPLRDIAIQWKSNGVVVGSFNQIAYGALMYISCRIQGDDRYAYSRTAFGLFLVGVLNTFTNYGHHTFHLPQSPWIHWISFVVSMLEAIILAKVFLDLLALWKARPAVPDVRVPVRLTRFATAWTCLLLILALAISIPPLNALIHGTYVVVTHVMGSMIAIDSLILWAALAYLLRFVAGTEHPTVAGARVYAVIPLANLLLLVFLGAFMARGITAGWARYAGPSAPDFSVFVTSFPTLIVLFGGLLSAVFLWMVAHWMLGFWSAVKPTGEPALSGSRARGLTGTEV